MFSFPEFIVYGSIMLLVILFAVLSIAYLQTFYLDLMGRTKGKITEHEEHLRESLIEEISDITKSHLQRVLTELEFIHTRVKNLEDNNPSNELSIMNNNFDDYKHAVINALDTVVCPSKKSHIHRKGISKMPKHKKRLKQ